MAQNQIWVLKDESELRCEIGENSSLSVKLIEGNAEIFGVELTLNKEYKFSDENVAIFSWYGCKIEMSPPNIEGVYISDTTPMVAYVNTHSQLEARRDAALSNNDDGPRVLILGAKDSGKSTASRILTSYAARLDRNPIYVDLDIAESGYGGIPGSLVALPIDKSMLSIETMFTTSTPLVYYYGSIYIEDNIKLYNKLCSNMASAIEQRFARDNDARSSGMIINANASNASNDGVAKESINHIVRVFAIDVVLVMESDRLFANLQNSLPSTVAVVKLPRSGGVVARDPAVRRRIRKERINEYFYGPKFLIETSSKLAPSRIDLQLSKIIVVRPGGVQISAAMRPIGFNESIDESTLAIVRPSTEWLHHILAVLHLDNNTLNSTEKNSNDLPPNLLSSNIGGFLYVCAVDIENDVMTVTSPCPCTVDTLPSRYLMIGNIKWVE